MVLRGGEKREIRGLKVGKRMVFRGEEKRERHKGFKSGKKKRENGV